jgi:hypothetical protein
MTPVAEARQTPPEPTLEDVILRTLAEGRVRRPGRWPACPICAAAMWGIDRPGHRVELHCGECGAVVADAERSAGALELAA